MKNSVVTRINALRYCGLVIWLTAHLPQRAVKVRSRCV